MDRITEPVTVGRRLRRRQGEGEGVDHDVIVILDDEGPSTRGELEPWVIRRQSDMDSLARDQELTDAVILAFSRRISERLWHKKDKDTSQIIDPVVFNAEVEMISTVSKEWTFVPACLRNHWILLVLHTEDISSNESTLLVFDSNRQREGYKTDVEFLKQRLEHRLTTRIGTCITATMCPQQMGINNCGVYALYYLWHFFRVPKRNHLREGGAKRWPFTAREPAVNGRWIIASDILGAPGIELPQNILEEDPVLREEELAVSLPEFSPRHLRSRAARARSSPRPSLNVRRQSRQFSRARTAVEPTYPCTQCPSRLGRPNLVMWHYYTVHLEGQIKCGRCGKTYTDNGGRLRHFKKDCKGMTKKQLDNEKAEIIRQIRERLGVQWPPQRDRQAN